MWSSPLASTPIAVTPNRFDSASRLSCSRSEKPSCRNNLRDSQNAGAVRVFLVVRIEGDELLGHQDTQDVQARAWNQPQLIGDCVDAQRLGRLAERAQDGDRARDRGELAPDDFPSRFCKRRLSADGRREEPLGVSSRARRYGVAPDSQPIERHFCQPPKGSATTLRRCKRRPSRRAS